MPTEQTNQVNRIEKMLGANWRVRVSGGAMLLCGAIALNPESVNFLPHTWQAPVIGICKLIVLASGGTFVFQTKSRQVTGGNITQDYKGKVKFKRTEY